MNTREAPYAFLDDKGVVARLADRGRLVVFGAEGLIADGSIQDDTLRKQLQRLRSRVPDPRVWFLFEPREDPETTARKLKTLRKEQIEPDKPPRVIFVAQSKAELLSASSNAFAKDDEINTLLLIDYFMVLVADDIHIDLKSTTGTQASDGLVPLSPIEEILAEHMSEAGLRYEAQVRLENYCVDFLVERNGERLIVEADGRDFHDATRDAERDRVILARHKLRTLRFSGSQIFRSPDHCVKVIISQLDGLAVLNFDLVDELRLDAKQAKAVEHGAGHARVLAPAGSGKTKVLVSRIVRLINSGADPTGILALAFNKKAAVQLEERLHALGVPLDRRSGVNGGVTVATLNAFAFRLLKAEGWSGEILDTKLKEARIVGDALKSIGIVLGPMRGSNPIVEVLEDINRIKRGLMPPSEEIIEVEQKQGTLKIEADRVWAAVQDLQARRHQISFEDQVFLAADVLLRNSEVRHRWQSRYDHVLVDEFQDLNPAQSLLVRTLVAPSAALFAVGDDDQLIYSWRSAEVRGLLDGFISTYEGATTYVLGTNYRCAKEIVRSGQRLIEHNKVRYPKTIKPADDAPSGDLELVAGDSLTELGTELVRFAQRHMSCGVRANEIAVLARTNTQLLAAALALDKAGIPRSALDGVKLYSTSVGRRLIAYLDSCLRGPLFANAALMSEIVNRPNRFVSNGDVEKMRSSRDPWMAAQFIARNRTKNQVRTNPLLQMLQDMERIAPKLHGPALTTAEKLQLLATTFPFLEKPDEKSRDREKATDDMVLEIMIEDAKGFRDLPSFLAHAKEVAALEENGQDKRTQQSTRSTQEPSVERVALSTIHAAKGREWSTVCLFDSSKPRGRQEIAPQDIEEERRVFYVGMTRASRNLQIGFVKDRPVQFIAEAFLPKGMKPGSPEDYQQLLAAAQRDADAAASRLEALQSALQRNRQELESETDGTRLRSEIQKIELEEASLVKDLEAARDALDEANKMKTSGRIGQLLRGRSSPQVKADMIASALDLMKQVEGRIEKTHNQKALAREASARREADLKQETQKISEELARIEVRLTQSLQQLVDLRRAEPLFTK